MKSIIVHGMTMGVTLEKEPDETHIVIDVDTPGRGSVIVVTAADDRALFDAARSFAPGTKVTITLAVDE